MKPTTAPNGPQTRSLTAKQEAAALSLATGKTQSEASTDSGAGVRTIKTWITQHSGFADRVRELRVELTSRALGRLTNDMVIAADTLGYLCSQGQSESVRLGAARAILELSTKIRESAELEERVSTLESLSE